MIRNIMQKVLPDGSDFVQIFFQYVFNCPVCDPGSIVCPFAGSLQSIVPVSFSKLQYTYARVVGLLNEKSGRQDPGNY